jgi:CdiI immunity protein
MRVVHVPETSALQQFALWFHQDFHVQFPDIESGVVAYFRCLTTAQRQVLRKELAAFLSTHEADSDGILRRAWMKLGVQITWPTRVKTRAMLTGFLSQL